MELAAQKLRLHHFDFWWDDPARDAKAKVLDAGAGCRN